MSPRESRESREHNRSLSRAMSEEVGQNSVGSTTLNHSKIEAFGTRMLTLLNNGATTLMISIGHKTELFETMASLPPVSSSDLATAAGLNERYVREWLAAMYVSGIVECESHGENTKTGEQELLYFLPPENAAFLTWGRGPENVAVLSQYVPILSAFEARTVECFRKGGGIASDQFGELKSIMAADAAQTIASSLVDWILPLGGQEIVSDLHAGVDVLDIQCGTGINLLALAKAFPLTWFTGYDTDASNIVMARSAAEKQSLRNVRFKVADIVNTSELSAYDVVTCFGALTETGNIRNVLKRTIQSLRRGGTLLIQDVAASSDARSNRAHPAGPLMYTVSVMFALPASIAKTGDVSEATGVMWGNDSAMRLIRDVGFKCEGAKKLPDDHCNVFFFCTKE